MPSACIVSRPLRRLLGVCARIDDSQAVALTFDDGPHREGTPLVLDALRRADAKATFFLVGEQVERHPELVQAILADGHEVAVHCHRHRNLMRLPPRAVREDLERAAAVLSAASGLDVRLYRPPYGILTGSAAAHARREGWQTVLWSRDGHDWARRATARSIATGAAAGLRGGEVLLLHDSDYYSAPGSWRRTVAALSLILDLVLEQGLGITGLERAVP